MQRLELVLSRGFLLMGGYKWPTKFKLGFSYEKMLLLKQLIAKEGRGHGFTHP